jgi:hypothetical protein
MIIGTFNIHRGQAQGQGRQNPKRDRSGREALSPRAAISPNVVKCSAWSIQRG